MKKERKEFEIWANKQLEDIQKYLLLQHFSIDKIKPSGKEDTSHAECRFPYKDIVIEYSESLLGYWRKGEKEEAYKILLHEMIHALTDPLYCVATDRFITRGQIENAREELTDILTNVVYKLKNGK